MIPRVVLDTNVLVSAFVSLTGAPAELRQAFERGEFDLCLSEPLFAEYRRVLARPHLRSLAERAGNAALVEQFLKEIGELAHWPESPLEISPVIQEDPDDDVILATALACEASAIVSGDKHVQNLAPEYRGIPIYTPRLFADALTALRSGPAGKEEGNEER